MQEVLICTQCKYKADRLQITVVVWGVKIVNGPVVVIEILNTFDKFRHRVMIPINSQSDSYFVFSGCWQTMWRKETKKMKKVPSFFFLKNNNNNID